MGVNLVLMPHQKVLNAVSYSVSLGSLRNTHGYQVPSRAISPSVLLMTWGQLSSDGSPVCTPGCEGGTVSLPPPPSTVRKVA